VFGLQFPIGRPPKGSARDGVSDETNFLPEWLAMRPKSILVSGSDDRCASFAFDVWNLVREEERQHLIESISRRLCAVVDANGERIDY
jgi:hypothetical protein